MVSSDKVQMVVEKLASINPYTNAKDLPDIPRPDECSIPRKLSSRQQLPHIQNVLNTLSYNFLPHTFFCLEKRRSLQSILLTSKEILAEALPIRCLEASFVGLYLTQELRDVDRIPLSFRSRAKGRAYHHIVLVVRCESMYGAVGLSRKATLMSKPLVYSSLYELIMEYKRQYEALQHELLDFKLGLCVTHKQNSERPPCWRYISVKVGRSTAASPEVSPRVVEQEEAVAPCDSPVVAAPNESSGCRHNLESILKCYSEMVSSISEDYENQPLFHMMGSAQQCQTIWLRDLHDMERDVARRENKRRLGELRCGRSPGVPFESVKKAAATRSLSRKRTLQSAANATGVKAKGRQPSLTGATKIARRERDGSQHSFHNRSQKSIQREPSAPMNQVGKQLPRVCKASKCVTLAQQHDERCNCLDDSRAISVGKQEAHDPSDCPVMLSLPLLDSKPAEATLAVSAAGSSWEYNAAPQAICVDESHCRISM